MNKITILSILMILICGCSGCGGSAGSGNASTNPGSWSSYSVESAAALPTCSGDIIGRLYYVEDSSSFQACKSTGWVVVSAGRGIQSIKTIGNSLVDYCTQNVGENCGFRSGQITTFTDNSVLVSVSFGYSFNSGGDTDVDEVHDSFLIPPTATGITKGLYPYVARGSGYKSVYTTWDRTTGSIKYYLDTNSDAVITGADELLFTPALVQIYP